MGLGEPVPLVSIGQGGGARDQVEGDVLGVGQRAELRGEVTQSCAVAAGPGGQDVDAHTARGGGLVLGEVVAC